MNQHFKWLCCMALVAGSIHSHAQQITNVSIIDSTNNNYTFAIDFFAPFGEGETCPPLTGYLEQTSATGDTLFIQCLYNVYGIWVQLGCGRTDTLTYVDVPYSISYINISCNTYANWETISDTTWNTSDTTIVINQPPTGTDNISIGNNSISVFPNPVSRNGTLYLNSQYAPKPESIRLFDITGKLIRVLPFSTSMKINGLAKGSYILEIRTKQEGSIRKKITVI